MAEGVNEPAFHDALPQAKIDIDPKTSDSVRDKSDLQESLSSLGLEQDKIQFIIEQGERFLQKPNVLAIKLQISLDLASKVINVLKDSKQSPQRILSPEEIKKIENCLKENPEIENHEDIALISEVSEELVSKYFEMLPLMEIKSVLTKMELSDNMKQFQSTIDKRMDTYLGFNNKQLENYFEEIWKGPFSVEEIWKGPFSVEDNEDEYRESEFSNLYSIFKMEYNAMENKTNISKWFRDNNYSMDLIIELIKVDILEGFRERPSSQSDRFIYTLNCYHVPIKDMVPYNGKPNYSYMCQKSLYEIKSEAVFKIFPTIKLSPFWWIPLGCKSLLEYCSGYYSHADIIWNPKKSIQVDYLASSLLDPEDQSTSTWQKFIRDISCDVLKLLSSSNSDVSPAVVKKIIHALCSRIRLLNYEIGFIHASLSNTAERILSTFVFAYAFKYHWEKKAQVRRDNRDKKEMKKPELFEYFKQKIEDHKMIKGGWNRGWMNTSDQRISRKYSLDFIESIKRGLKTHEQQNLTNIFEDICRKESLSNESILALAYEKVQSEIAKDPKMVVIGVDHFVVQYVCNRNALLQDLFSSEWSKVETVLYDKISQRMALTFKTKISNLKSVIGNLLQDLGNASMENIRKFESDSYFEFGDQKYRNFDETQKIPFKAMNAYFSKYLDPTLTPEEFKNFFLNVFEVDGVKVRVCETYILPCKHPEPVLDEDNFRKLLNTEMFNDTELIFNLYTYVENFLSILDMYYFKLEKDEFQDFISDLKKELEKEVLGCPSQCPSCGKFCERKIHPNEGNCQIKTGHQISSMGGNVWNADKNHSAIMFMCDDYKDDTQINLPVGEMKWREFKDRYGSEWNWNPPCDEKYKSKQLSNPELMKNIWNKFGRSILEYHSQFQGVEISFVPYTTYEEIIESLLPLKYYICFVIDGTGSMNLDISRVRLSVGQLISSFISQGHSAQFRIVVYRDHCDDKLIETFPHGSEFTPEQNLIEDFLNGIRTTGGGDFPEAVLDGLATAATQSEWKRAPGFRNKVIHIFDAPPHGDFPNHTEHKSYSKKRSCCCCNQGTICMFDWDRDVWSMFKKFDIEYYAINTTPCKFEVNTLGNLRRTIKKKALEYRHWVTIDLVYTKYELKMRQELGHLCGTFQDVGKEVVNDAILKIFVDFKDKSDFSISMSYDPMNTI